MARTARFHFAGYRLMLIGFSALTGFSTLLSNEAYGPDATTLVKAQADGSLHVNRLDSTMTIQTFNAIHAAQPPGAEGSAADVLQAGTGAPDSPVHVRGLDSYLPTPDFSAPSVEDRNRMMVENARLEQLSGRPGTITNPGIPDFDRMARDLNRALQGGTLQTRATSRSSPL